MAASPGDEVGGVRREIAQGELLAAYDRATSLLAAAPKSLELRYLATLALARAGATEHAHERYLAWHLAERARGRVRPGLRTDILALAARLAKDRALKAPPRARSPFLREAASAYQRVFRITGDAFPGVNAATLWRLAGEKVRAVALARAVERACLARRGVRKGGVDEYYTLATLAEAALVRGDLAGAGRHLADAGVLAPLDWGAAAQTRRQLGLLCDALGCDRALLDALPRPGVIHFAGHRLGSRFAAAAEPLVRARIRSQLDERRVTSGYGSLASGADILFAEALLERRAELHVVLPFAVEEFRRASVQPEGGWLERFERCFARASSVTFATNDRHHGDDEVFSYTSRIAMGLATIRARFLGTVPLQIAVWDGRVDERPSQTLLDVLTWQATGNPSLAIASRAAELPAEVRIRRVRRAGAGHAGRGSPRRLTRVTRAMLFGDFHGFSKLDDLQTQRFVRELMGRVGRVLDGHARGVRFKNTWGDGLYVVLDDVRSAARLALELQASLARVDLERLGLPRELALRIGGHAGPVFEADDPVLHRRSFFGSHVSRTARIEPVALPGAVYVSDLFAATLALEQDEHLRLEYVGRVESAKGYGVMGMYRLEGRP